MKQEGEYKHLLLIKGKLRNGGKLKDYKIIKCTFIHSRMKVHLKRKENNSPKLVKLNWNEALKPMANSLADFLLYNHRKLSELVPAEEYSFSKSEVVVDVDYSLDSQVVRLIEDQSERIYILGLTTGYLYSLDSLMSKVYYLKFEDRMSQEAIARKMGINFKTVKSWADTMRKDLIDYLDEGDVYLDNIYRFKLKYKWIEQKMKKTPA